MHPSAMSNAKFFFETYLKNKNNPIIVEIGSQDVNGSLREVSPPSTYIGLDFVEGKGVDVVLDDPYNLPLEDRFADVVVTSSCFEHSEFFWKSFEEAIRILKDNGLLYVNVPSNGLFHRYPKDYWRFYPDAGHALAAWGREKGFKCVLLESYISKQGEGREGLWNDFVAIFLKDESYISSYPDRVSSDIEKIENNFQYGSQEILNYEMESEDLRNIAQLHSQVSSLESIKANFEKEIEFKTDSFLKVEEELRLDVFSKASYIEALKNQVNELELKSAQLDAQISFVKESECYLKNNIKKLQASEENLNAHVSDLNLKINSLKSNEENLKSNVSDLNLKIISLESSEENLKSNVSDLNLKIHSLESIEENLKSNVSDLNLEIHSLEVNRENLQAEVRSLESLNAHKDEQIKAIMNSYSWRLTKPLRYAKKLLRGA